MKLPERLPNNKAYIYTLSDPITFQIRYVGRTRFPRRRYYAHLKIPKNKISHKINWVKSLKSKKLKPKFEVLDIVNLDECKFWERFWISQIKSWGFKLVNIADGGEGPINGNSGSFKKGGTPWNKGKYVRLNIDNEFQKGQRPHNLKKVLQYSLNGELIDIYQSLSEAENKVGVSSSKISPVCKNKRRSAGNFYWRYYDGCPLISRKIYVPVVTKGLPRMVVRIEDNYLYKTVTEAAKMNNTYIYVIVNHCKKRINNPKFKYLDNGK